MKITVPAEGLQSGSSNEAKPKADCSKEMEIESEITCNLQFHKLKQIAKAC